MNHPKKKLLVRTKTKVLQSFLVHKKDKKKNTNSRGKKPSIIELTKKLFLFIMVKEMGRKRQKRTRKRCKRKNLQAHKKEQEVGTKQAMRARLQRLAKEESTTGKLVVSFASSGSNF
jgi:hypothetical protein